jgi:hypothetical protein
VTGVRIRTRKRGFNETTIIRTCCVVLNHFAGLHRNRRELLSARQTAGLPRFKLIVFNAMDLADRSRGASNAGLPATRFSWSTETVALRPPAIRH